MCTLKILAKNAFNDAPFSVAVDLGKAVLDRAQRVLVLGNSENLRAISVRHRDAMHVENSRRIFLALFVVDGNALNNHHVHNQFVASVGFDRCCRLFVIEYDTQRIDEKIRSNVLCRQPIVGERDRNRTLCVSNAFARLPKVEIRFARNNIAFARRFGRNTQTKQREK